MHTRKHTWAHGKAWQIKEPSSTHPHTRKHTWAHGKPWQIEEPSSTHPQTHKHTRAQAHTRTLVHKYTHSSPHVLQVCLSVFDSPPASCLLLPTSPSLCLPAPATACLLPASASRLCLTVLPLACPCYCRQVNAAEVGSEPLGEFLHIASMLVPLYTPRATELVMFGR